MRGASLKADYQTPRQSFFWVSLAQIACTLPHVVTIPVWVSVLCGFCWFWRWMVYQGRWSFPHRYARYGLVIVAIFGLMLTSSKMLSVQAAVTLLIITYYMKLLEMFRLKDVYVILILSYFVIATAFLFREDILMLVYFISAFLLTTVGLLSSNRTEAKLAHGGTLKKGLMLCLQAAPIGLCLFLFFPRFPPFWVLDLQKPGPSIGLSDSMSPAEVAALGASPGVAFRVEFQGAPPPPEQLYWRVLTLSKFDGVNWASLFTNQRAQDYFEQLGMYERIQQGVQSSGVEFKYRLSLEVSEKQWLPVLDRPVFLSEQSLLMPDFSFIRPEPVSSLIGYTGVSAPAAILDATITPWMRQENLRLPKGFNPKATRYARETFEDLGGSDQAFVDYLMTQFRDEEYFYTLKPGTYGDDMIDEFYFDRRKGFCAHYASAMVAMLRAVGIPSRVVIGYHGGVVNPIGGHMIVNQYDAHAWVEAWFPNQGWVRYDPTAMVAPWRVLLGVEEMMRQTTSSEVPSLQKSFLLSNPLANQVRLLLDFTNHRWNKYVVNFDDVSQRELFENYFEKWDSRNLVWLMALSVGSILALIAAGLLWRSRARSLRAEDRILNGCLAKISDRYPARDPGMPPRAYAEELKQHMKPVVYGYFDQVVSLHEKIAYEELDPHEYKSSLRLLRLKSHQLQRQLRHIFR